MPVWCLLRYNVLLSLFGAGENEAVLEGISANKVPSSAEKRWGSANAGRGWRSHVLLSSLGGWILTF